MLVTAMILLIFLAVVGVGVLFGAPFVPTRKRWIKEALDLAEVGKDDVVVDLGSGDGVVLREAIKRGAERVVGYEINPLLVAWSRIMASSLNGKSTRRPDEKSDKRITIEPGNLFSKKFPPDATVFYVFQVNKVMRRIPDKIRAERGHIRAKKIRVVCFGFELPGEKIVRKNNGMQLYEF